MQNSVLFKFPLLKKLLCKHSYKLVRNIYGDEIISCGYKRSIWKCNKCDKYKYKNNLHEE